MWAFGPLRGRVWGSWVPAPPVFSVFCFSLPPSYLGPLGPHTNRDIHLGRPGRSAHVGNADLRKGNTFLRSRTSAALGVVREGAVHRFLDTCTETTRGRAQVKTQDPTSKLARSEREVKLSGERVPKLTECLRSEARRPWPMKRWSNSSLQVIDPKASAAPSWSGMTSATIPRSMSDPLDGQCMPTAVLRRCSSVRQATAVEGDTPSKVHDVTMLIDAAH